MAIHFAVLFALASIAAAQAGPSLPDTPPGRLMATWLGVFNAGEPKALTAFIAQHYSAENLRGRPPERIGEGHMEMRQDSQGFDLWKVVSSSPNEVRVILRSRGVLTQYVTGFFAVDPASPEQVTRSGFDMIPTPPEAQPAPMTVAELSRDLDTRLRRLVAENRFSGAVLIAKDGKPLWQRAYGLADREKRRPATLETRFRLGSMNKMMTSVAIAQLVQAGKLRYSDTLANLLPDYPNRDAARKITVAQILTHSAGLGDFFTPEFMAHKEKYRELADYVSLFANEPLRFEPGTSWAYSNGGFLLLGLIVQKVSGQDYYDYIKEHIYDPAGMRSSGSTPKDRFPPEMAIGYTRMDSPDGTLRSNYETLPWRGSSAGGGESTVGDLLRFATALRGNRLLNRELTDLVTTGKLTTDWGDAERKYAYGFEDRRDGGRRTVGHGGGAPGMNGMLEIYWDEGYTVVVLANLDPPAAQNVAEFIRERLDGGARKAAPGT